MTTSATAAIVTALAAAYLVGLVQGHRVGHGRASRRYTRALSGRGSHPGRTLVLIGALVAIAYLYAH
jgi:hypothetical protein